MNDTLEPWVNLARMVLHRATLDARAGASIRLRIEARSFLFEPCSEPLMELLDLDVEAVRDNVLRQWVGHNMYNATANRGPIDTKPCYGKMRTADERQGP